MSFIILFILWLTFLRPGPQEYQSPKQQEEKTYTVTLTERDISKIEKVIGHHLKWIQKLLLWVIIEPR